jgi:hypothetical protein
VCVAAIPLEKEDADDTRANVEGFRGVVREWCGHGMPPRV